MSIIRLEKSRAMKECEKARISMIAVQIIVFLAIFFIFQNWGGMLLRPFVPMLVQGKDEAGVYVAITAASNLIFLILIILPISYSLLVEKRSIAGMGFYGNVWKSAFAGIAVGFVLTVLVAGIQVVTGSADIEWAGTLAVSPCILFFLTFIIQSSGEEVLCRGYLMNGLGGRHSWMFAAVVNAVAFGALHLFNSGINLLSFINVIIAGLFFSVVTIRYNLWVACGIHSMWNFSEGFIFGSNISGNEAMMSMFCVTPTNRPAWLTGGEFGIEGSIVVTIVNIIGIAVVLLLPKSSKGEAAESA